MTTLRWVAFGGLDGAGWGLAWIPDHPGPGHAVLEADGPCHVVEATLDAAAAAEDWVLRADGVELTVSPSSPDATDGLAADSGRVSQLARVTGSFAVAGAEHRVDCPGWRGEERGIPVAGELDSLRLLAAWFDGGHGVAVMAVRPRNTRGHQDDRVTAALFESGSAQSVLDPRLSTTYTGEDVPARAGIELWVSEPAQEPEAPRERPHRLAGEARATPASWTEDGLALGAQPFRWHSQGGDGVGVYVLARAG